MTEKQRFLFGGGLLIVLAIAWTTIVWKTIPPGMGGGDVGPRAFPLLLGILLGVLALGMVINALRPAVDVEARADLESTENAGSVWPAVLTLVHIIAYGFLMQKLGFVISTVLVVASVMIICVGDRKPLRIAAMSIGVALGTWLVFGKILGVYLAVGTWFNLG